MNSFIVQPSFKGRFVATTRNKEGATVLEYNDTFMGALGSLLRKLYPSGTISLA